MTPSRLQLLPLAALTILSCAADAHSRRGATSQPAVEQADPRAHIKRANDAARVQPERGGYFNAIQQYAYAEGSLFQIYTAPGQVTDLVLQEGEELVGPGPVASGDTVRWIIGDTVSGTGAKRRVHILVKPTRSDISTNLIINTDRRTYHLELQSTLSTYMASVSWTYAQDALIALRTEENANAATLAGGGALDGLNFDYRIAGDRPKWRPLRVFDDARQVFVEFSADIATDEMPPLFVLGPDETPELVNYRVHGRYMIVDRLFERAELRLGVGKKMKKVRIERRGRPS